MWLVFFSLLVYQLVLLVLLLNVFDDVPVCRRVTDSHVEGQ